MSKAEPVRPAQSNADVVVSADPARRTMLERARRFFFGDDVFISYARADAYGYALALAVELAKQEIACFADHWGTPPGDRIPDAVLRSVRKSTMLVLLGSERAASSHAVRQEVEAFLTTGRPIIPVSFGGALEQASWFSRIRGLSLAHDSPDALAAARPSDAVVSRIVNADGFTRRNKRLRQVFWTTAAVIGVLALAGSGVLMYQANRVEDALTEVAVADSLTRVAQDSMLQAQAQAGDAQSAAASAEEQRQNAEQLAEQAELQARQASESEAVARAGADEQRRIARALNLANQASSTLDGTAAGLTRSTLLAVESLGFAWTPEGFGAWAHAMELLPHPPIREAAHATGVAAIVFSGDGNRLASAGMDGPARVWDVDHGRIVRPREVDATAPIRVLALSHDGGVLAMNGAGETVRILDVETRALTELNVEGGARVLAFAPDGGRLVASAGESTAHVFERAGATWREGARMVYGRTAFERTRGSGVVVARFLDHAFSRDGRHLLSVVSDGLTLRQVEPPQRQVLRLVDEAPGRSPLWSAGAAAFAGLTTFATSHGNHVRVWSVQTVAQDSLQVNQRVLWQPHGGHEVTGLAFSADGRYLATAGTDSTARIWMVSTNEDEVQREVARLAGVNHVFALHPQERLLAAGNQDGTIGLWRIDDGAEVQRVRVANPGRVLFSPDSRWLAAGGANRWTVYAMDALRASATLAGNWIAFRPDAGQVAVIRPGAQDTLLLFGVDSWLAGPPITLEQTYSFLSPISFSPDGDWLATTIRSRSSALVCARQVHVWNARTGRLAAWRGDECDRATPAAVRGNAGLLARSANWPVIMAIAGVNTIPGILPAGPHHGDGSGRWRAERGRIAGVELREAGTGRSVATLGQRRMTDHAFSRDGSWLATVSGDSVVRVWPVSPDARQRLIDYACSRLPLKRLTDEEWRIYVTEGEPRNTCPPDSAGTTNAVRHETIR